MRALIDDRIDRASAEIEGEISRRCDGDGRQPDQGCDRKGYEQTDRQDTRSDQPGLEVSDDAVWDSEQNTEGRADDREDSPA